MKWVCALLLSLMLCLPAQAKPYSIMVGLPSDAWELGNTGDRAVYFHENGEYRIVTSRFPARDLAEAAEKLTEKSVSAGKKRTRFGMEEYILQWQGGKADVLLDGSFGYAVVFTDFTGRHGCLAWEVFSTFGLYYDEGVRLFSAEGFAEGGKGALAAFGTSCGAHGPAVKNDAVAEV